MARKRYISARGEEIPFDELTIRNSNTIAIGNAKMNARGDLLGEGGQIIETAEQLKAKTQKMKENNQSYNTNNPNAVKMVSIKKNIDDLATAYNEQSNLIDELEANEAKTPVEVLKNVEEDKIKTTKSNIDNKTKSKRKLIDK